MAQALQGFSSLGLQEAMFGAYLKVSGIEVLMRDSGSTNKDQVLSGGMFLGLPWGMCGVCLEVPQTPKSWYGISP